tara:strand:- start:4 stop:1584 length:1581 start_codon:yes stop_codon:yes gene_type:complete
MRPDETGISDAPRQALLYCRVSTKRQSQEGHGLDSQEHRCRQYAAAKGYEVEAVFPDDVSGGGDFMKRPGMVALLRYLDEHADENYVVIFDDLKRYARDTEFHLKLRREMAARGATRECLNFNFEDSPEGKFFETIAAAQGELERAQNGRQVTQKMRARVEKGFYCFAPRLGYRYQDHPDGGRILTPDEPNASIVREAMEGYAAGRFQSTSEVKRFLDQHPSVFKRGGTEVSWQTVKDILRNPLYAGRITVERWNIHLLPGKHEPLISFATWQKVQDRLEGRAQAPARKDFKADFPLRGFVCCASCDHPMTAAWSKGRYAHYPYYVCYQKGCELRGKSIRREKIESAFEILLKQLTPAPALMALVRAMFTDRWQQQSSSADQVAASARRDIAGVEAKIAKLVDRIMASENERVIKAYEDQIKSLDKQKITLAEIAANAAHPKKTFDESFRTAWAFLSNPWKLWDSGVLEHQRLVLRLAFSEPIPYCRNEGFRTACIAEPLRLLRGFEGKNLGMVGATGIEPVTPAV